MPHLTALALVGALVAGLVACSTGTPTAPPPARTAVIQVRPGVRTDPLAQLRVGADGRAFLPRDVIERVFLDVTRDVRDDGESAAGAVALGRSICRALASGRSPAQVAQRLVAGGRAQDVARRWVDDATLLCPRR
jgi:hypothetical protein